MAREVTGLDESALLLSSARPEDSFNDGVLAASEIARLSINARLVVLSACNSARYDVRRATLGVHDLYGAFTVAGAPTLLASLWPIDSSTARDLIISFFQDWRSGQSGGAATSLAAATRPFLEKADAPHNHPRFWSSFVVVGYGGVAGGTPATAGQVPAQFALVRDDVGEITSLLRADNSLVLSTTDWGTTKVISRRSDDGREM